MNPQAEKKKGFSGKQVFAIVFGVMLVTVVVTIFIIRTWLFPQPFTPVALSQQEEQQLEQKLVQLDSLSAPTTDRQPEIVVKPTDVNTPKQDFNRDGTLNPEAFSNKEGTREITFSEREINAMLAKNTDLAQKIAIDLDKDLISLRLLLPVDPDFPIMGGKTIRARAGAELAFRENRPVVILKGVSLMGVPIPNAWMGGLKNIDLVQEFGDTQGFWKTFGDGVETIRVQEGELYIKLKE